MLAQSRFDLGPTAGSKSCFPFSMSELGFITFGARTQGYFYIARVVETRPYRMYLIQPSFINES